MSRPLTKEELDNMVSGIAANDPYHGVDRSEYKSPNWPYVYGAVVAMLVKEYHDKGWGSLSLVDMEGIVSKASAIATMESTAWLTT